MIRVKKDKLEQLNLDNGTTNLLEYLYENKNKDNIFVVKTKSQLSKDYGLSLSTINKRLKVLQDNNIIKLTTKRGKNGGTIISF
nr:HTH DNA binding protein [Staphylococcus phage S-CoN_Ph38]